MVDAALEGTAVPSGEFEVEGYKAHLWADATRSDQDAYRYDEDAKALGEPGQLVPPSMCQHIVFEATGGIDATMSRLADDWREGAALGGLRVDLHAPVEVDTTLVVEGTIESVTEKEGGSRPFTLVTTAYTAETTDGDRVFDLETDMIILGDD